MKNKVGCFICLCLFLSLTSCIEMEDEINMSLIEKKLNTETDNYMRLRLFNCREDVLREAEMFVDSIMINEISFNLGGNLYFPNRPNKPGYIGNIQLNDSTKPKPFLDFIQSNTPSQTDSLNN